MRTIFFWRREKNGEIFNVKMFGKMKNVPTRIGFYPHKRPTGERANFQCKNVWKIIFNVKMFGKFSKIPQSIALSNFLSGPLFECLRYGNGRE